MIVSPCGKEQIRWKSERAENENRAREVEVEVEVLCRALGYIETGRQRQGAGAC